MQDHYTRVAQAAIEALGLKPAFKGENPLATLGFEMGSSVTYESALRAVIDAAAKDAEVRNG